MSHSTHVLFAASDFTAEERARRNVLAVAVIEKRERVCKACGDSGHLLESLCRASKVYAQLDIHNRNFEDNLRNELENDDGSDAR